MTPLPKELDRSIRIRMGSSLGSLGRRERSKGGRFDDFSSPLTLRKDVRYVPTPPVVVEAMLDLAEVQSGDVIYDLGSGDGRLIVAAASRGAQGLGIDIDPSLVRRSQASAVASGCSDLAHFQCADLFQIDLSPANVVMLYLRQHLNLSLRPKLQRELRVGSRIVSHSYSLGDRPPTKTIEVDAKFLYLWIV